MRALAVLASTMLIASAATAQMIGGDHPTLFPPVVSTDGSWQAWLQHTGGGIQPIYYSVVVQRRGGAPCIAATATGPDLERRMTLYWEGPNRLVVRHSLNGDAAGRYNGIRHGCGDIYLRAIDTSR